MRTGSKKARSVGLWILTGLLGALYVFAGGTKLMGMEVHVEHFAQWGYPQWFRLFVGAWEVIFGVLLLIPRLLFYGAAFLGIAMIGAVYTELFRGQPSMATPPAILLMLLALIAYARRPVQARSPRQTARVS